MSFALVIACYFTVVTPVFSRVLPVGERFTPLDVPWCSRHTVVVAELSNAEVGAIVRQRMKKCGLTERALRIKAGVDRKTLTALLEGSRASQEDTQLKVERALAWEAGSIEDIRAGRTPTPIVSKPVSPLRIVSDEDLLTELIARMRSYRSSSVRGQQLQNRPVRTPDNWLQPGSEELGVFRDHDGEERDQPSG